MRANPSHSTYAAILLLVGANMVVDPENFTGLMESLTTGVRNAVWKEMSRHPWRHQWRREPIAGFSLSRIRIRVAGAILIAVGLLAAAVS